LDAAIRFMSFSFWAVLTGFLVVIFLNLTISIISSILGSGDLYVERSYIKSEIFSAINNGGDLRAAKNIYENRRYLERGFFSVFSSDDEYYGYSVTMSKILEDVRSDYFLKEIEDANRYRSYSENEYIRKSDADSISKIDRIIEEYEQLNPFEGLEAAQKDNFENVRIKLGDKYALISGDMEKLSSDLRGRNELVGQYLKDSTISFWVSIVALFFSLVVSAYQIYLGRDSRVKDILAAAVNETRA
jgi:hypothetical protein